MQTAVFGGGCFWCTEAVFLSLKGVMLVEPGYSGGSLENPTYEQVSSGSTGHTEAIKIVFDESQITFRELLEVFFATHDPTTLNRQGHDVGSQYRSAVFYMDQQQKQETEAIIKELEEEKESNQAELQLHNKRQTKTTRLRYKWKYDSETETEIIVES